MSEDVVNKPRHYNQNGIEVIEVIETYAKSDFRLANVIKYVCRCEYKGKKLEDLKKARWYLNRVIAELEEEEGVTYVYTGPDRIAGDDDAAMRIKADYYAFSAGDPVCKCSNAACRAQLYANDTYLRDWKGRRFCTYVCLQLLNEAESR